LPVNSQVKPRAKLRAAAAAAAAATRLLAM